MPHRSSAPKAVGTRIRAGAASDIARDGWVVLHRIRIENRPSGRVQARAESDSDWTTLGRVRSPATRSMDGFQAAGYLQAGEVAAVAVHGIRIRTGGRADRNAHNPLVVSIVPPEFAGPQPSSFGGHVAGSAGIVVDIPAGTSIFRDLAPYPGNRAWLETRSGGLEPLPTGWIPTTNDVLVLCVERPANPLVGVVIPNRVGGEVELSYQDGSTESAGHVVKIVEGTGRFDGTSLTGTGRLNTAHGGVITVGTARVDASQPEGTGRERRGGFQISPKWHSNRYDGDMKSVLQIGGLDPDGRPARRPAPFLEGRAPLFRDGVSLAGEAAVVDCRVDDGPWEALPIVTGARLDAFLGEALQEILAAQGRRRNVRHGITAFRLRMPERAPSAASELIAMEARRAQARRLAAAKRDRTPIVHGRYTIKVRPTDPSRVGYVRLRVDGAIKAFSNVAPYELQWDTTKVADGDYVVQAEVLDATGAVMAVTSRKVVVDNGSPGGPG